MNKLHQSYLEETGGRKITYAVWLEKKLEWFASGYEEMMLLIQDAHHLLRNGSPEEQRKLADEIAAGLKDTGLFDDAQPADVPAVTSIEGGVVTLNRAPRPGEGVPAMTIEDKPE